MNTRNSGFTVIELMVTLMVVAIVLGVGVPSLNDFFATNRMSAAVNDLVTALHAARSEAVKRRANVTICASADWDSVNPSCDAAGSLADGWIVFVDCDGNPPPPGGVCGLPDGDVDGNDIVLNAHGPMHESIAGPFESDAAGQEFVTYAATGFPRNLANNSVPASNFELCDDRGNHDTGNGIAAGRWIQISITGRPQIYRTVADLQGNSPLGGC